MNNQISVVNNTPYAYQKVESMLELAKLMQRFCKENNLTTTIEGKEFPNVEAWQFLGANIGVSAVVESVENTSTYQQKNVRYYTKKGGWQTKDITCFSAKATCKLVVIATGEVIGYGEAICTNEESNKVHFEEYAMLSMAQTRVISKTYRLNFGWVMKAASFEATPAEEMYEGKYTIVPEPEQTETPKKKEEKEVVKSDNITLTPEQKNLQKFLKENITSALFSKGQITTLRSYFEEWLHWDSERIKGEFELIKSKIELQKFLKENITSALFSKGQITTLRSYFEEWLHWDSERIKGEFELIKSKIELQKFLKENITPTLFSEKDIKDFRRYFKDFLLFGADRIEKGFAYIKNRVDTCKEHLLHEEHIRQTQQQ